MSKEKFRSRQKDRREVGDEKRSNKQETHENHPIPQPKQGRGLSKIPS